ncbi:MAG TPA: BREX system P-loop protein BrxC, partial [Balneolaceae bacterium]|nr:BREX system P-loop protein BrxC [Balneolaceae bacterium]
IVTDNIAEHFEKFIDLYTSNIKETGVWISGFYGSGKSYFGKMLGYLLENPTINGTPARDRFKPRLSGVKGEELLKNEIGKLEGHNTLLVMLDVAKQSGKHGLHYMLFRNFLRSLGFLDNLYGIFEFELSLDGELDEFKDRVKKNEGKEWSEIKKHSMKVPAAVGRALTDWKYTEDEYNKTREFLEDEIESFSPSRLKEKLKLYLDKFPDTKIVFIFDEASEAIAQDKIKLDDLEGVSEALTSISQKVWTVAIAQEKLDDVINNSNVSKKNLTKVTDRFKTKIPLESTEVDKIIRSRLLQKKEDAMSELEKYYNKNVGLVSENTNLESTFPTKTEDVEEFKTYYPFHRYQFDLLQNFLFQSKTLTSTQVAARGMIITTFDVLRKQLKDTDLFNFATSYHLTTEAQPNPDAALVNKYDNASKILHNGGSEIDGKKLLKAIHFIGESERVKATASNITKMYLSDIGQYHDVKPQIDEALTLLKDQKILIENNHVYKITSDLETKLLKELNELPVELH